jgi:hypothetical protein
VGSENEGLDPYTKHPEGRSCQSVTERVRGALKFWAQACPEGFRRKIPFRNGNGVYGNYFYSAFYNKWKLPWIHVLLKTLPCASALNRNQNLMEKE